MVKVEINSRSNEVWDWKKQVVEFETIPRTGEFLHLAPEQNWYRVENVVHRGKRIEPGIVIFAVDSGMAMEFIDDAS